MISLLLGHSENTRKCSSEAFAMRRENLRFFLGGGKGFGATSSSAHGSLFMCLEGIIAVPRIESGVAA